MQRTFDMKQRNANQFIFCFGKPIARLILFFLGININTSLTCQETSGLLILDLGKLRVACSSSFAPTSKIMIFPVVIDLSYMEA